MTPWLKLNKVIYNIQYEHIRNLAVVSKKKTFVTKEIHKFTFADSSKNYTGLSASVIFMFFYFLIFFL